jgi:hypothetical protein
VVVTEGPGRALYWLAIDPSVREPGTVALRLATNTAFYVACVKMARDASASSIKLTGRGPFAAVLDLVPFQFGAPDEDKDGGWVEPGGGVPPTPDFACRWQTEVGWAPAKGFTIKQRITRCPKRPPLTRVEIGAEGSLRAVPDPKALDERP